MIKKIFLLMLLTCAFASSIFCEEINLNAAQKESLPRYNRIYDSLYTKKAFHGKDSVAAVKRMRIYHQLFNK